MALLSRPLTVVGLVLLAHGCYSAHEHTVLSATSVQHPSSPSAASLPLDIYIETIAATFLICLGLVLGSGSPEPIEWHTWAGKIEREGDAAAGDADKDARGNPFNALEARSGFINISKLRDDFVKYQQLGK
ncbi:magnesium transporter [Trichoderma chlorosporum]